MSADHHEGLSPAGPAEDEMGDQPRATPPLTDGHTASGEPGSQVLLVCCKHRQHTMHDKLNVQPSHFASRSLQPPAVLLSCL